MPAARAQDGRSGRAPGRRAPSGTPRRIASSNVARMPRALSRKESVRMPAPLTTSRSACRIASRNFVASPALRPPRAPFHSEHGTKESGPAQHEPAFEPSARFGDTAGQPPADRPEQTSLQQQLTTANRDCFDVTTVAGDALGRVGDDLDRRRRPQLAQPRHRDSEHGEVANVLAVVTARVDEDIHRAQLSSPSPATRASQRRCRRWTCPL